MEENNTAIQSGEAPAPSELIELQKRQNLFQMITMILVGAITIAVIVVSAIIVPKAVTTFNKAEQVISQVEGSIDDFAGAAESVRNLIDSNIDSVTDALEKIGEIDMDSLNDSIKNLSDVMESFSAITTIFK